MSALETAVTGLNATSTEIDVIANNLANVNTTGYKNQRTNFSDLFYRQIRPVGVNALGTNQVPDGIQIGTGVRVLATSRNFIDGPIEQTGADLDMAIQGGKGYFQVTLANGETGYTRDGSFTLNQDGDIVDSNGNRLDPVITLPDDVENINISPGGVVTGRVGGDTELTNFGTLDVAIFVNDNGLLEIGDNIFLETVQSGPPNVGEPGIDGRGQIVQKALEASNVNLAEELVGMIKAQRAFEINSQVIQTADEMKQTIGQLRR